jgi:two-component system OmpR family sensor kinase
VKTLSLRTRLTLWYTLALVIAVCLFGANVLWGQGRLGVRRLDRELDGVTGTAANIIRGELRERVSLPSAAEEASEALAGTGSAVVVLDQGGAPIAASWSGLNMEGPFPPARAGARVWTAETPGGAWRIHAQPLSFDHTSFVLLIARPLADVRREQHEVLEAMEVAIPIVLLLAGGGGFWLASVGLRPITEMAHRAARIAPTGMDDLGHAERTDELGQLARAFNGLVARLRTALQVQRQFMADASHELRTPVSVMRAAADVALSCPRREEADYRETLGIVGDQTRRLSRLVDNMLILARADAGGYPLRPVDLYLDEVVTDCCRALNALSKQRQVTIHLGDSPEIPFRGDEDLLRQLVLNVLQNAVQHTDGDRERVFDRFVQLDPSRRGTGTGLGLPIARWIAEAHRGTLVLESSGPSGSTFCISLRRARRTDPSP